MRIAGVYSFKNGEQVLRSTHPAALGDITRAIASVDAAAHKTKVSTEKTMRDRVLYNPRSLNIAFKTAFSALGWRSHRILCQYSGAHYTADYSAAPAPHGAFREMDFVKDGVGVEVQFGKYAFMVYNVCAKMTIFRNEGVIDTGVEVVPLREFANEMSTGVSYFEQIVWNLERRGVADIDIPVLILGITS